ncbi:MAG: 5-(carboxyamino)imidazole ribonucleotide mutase [Nitrospirae bacterium]|nr:MAG: 5-(carboxyamino)imidazole ribonucleotide mutase [Nitrospirota bacterium]
MSRVVIIMGSKADMQWAEEIRKLLLEFGIDVVMRVSSAHKTPIRCHEIIKEYEKEGVVFITVAGRSNALGGFTDAQTHCPVISCPPRSDRLWEVDIYSSLRMPSGVAPLVITEAEGAALAAAKIIALSDERVRERVIQYQEKMREKIFKADEEIANG